MNLIGVKRSCFTPINKKGRNYQMRIAISTDGDRVSSHFGRCPSFTIVDIENGAVKNVETIRNPGHHPGFLPEFLKGNGVEYIVAGGMGPKAANLFSQFGIKVVVGITGTVEETVRKLASETLEAGESLCKPGLGKGYGIEKTEKEEVS